jgi:hypothetical protein
MAPKKPEKPTIDTDTILADIDAELDTMEKLLNKIREENELLRETVTKKDAEIITLKTRLNAVEQYNRSLSIRINNLPVARGSIVHPPPYQVYLIQNK